MVKLSSPRQQRHSTAVKHRQLYDRYRELIGEAQARLGGLPQMLYTSYFYQQLSEEFGYGISYISTVINREQRRRAAEERARDRETEQRNRKLKQALGDD